MVSMILAMITLMGFGLLLADRVSKPFEFRFVREVDPSLSVLAWLAGGGRRVAQVWWAQLSRNNLMMIDATGKTYSVAPCIPEDLDPWLRAAMVQAGRSKTPHEILLAWRTPLESLRGYMEQSGWIVPHEQYQARAHAIMLFVLLGTIAACAGAWLAGWGFVSALVFLEIIGLALFAQSRIPDRLSPHAQAHLEKARDLNHHSTLAPQGDDVGVAVALGGAGVLLGTPFETHASPAAKKEASSGCGGGCAAMVASWGSDTQGGEGGSGCDSSGGGSSGCGGGGCGGD